MFKLRYIFLALTVIIMVPLMYLTFGENRPTPTMTWGVSFSEKAAEGLGMNWKETYLSLLDDLKVSNFRISAYWDILEPQRGQFNFENLDFMIEQARLRDRKIVLAVGRRLPRWPECHLPGWAKELNTNDQNQATLDQVKKVVERYRNDKSIIAWQVENEFFVTWFGECLGQPQEDFFTRELALVKSLDNSRPIIVTDSGELSLWWKAASHAEIFGTTMYRRVYDKILGTAVWPYPPVYYSRLGGFIQMFTGFKKMIIAELQAEPWAKTTLQNDPVEENNKTLSLQQFQKNITFARNSGIDEAYLWGAEWWYYMKEKRGISGYWETARQLWKAE